MILRIRLESFTAKSSLSLIARSRHFIHFRKLAGQFIINIVLMTYLDLTCSKSNFMTCYSQKYDHFRIENEHLHDHSQSCLVRHLGL
ncbi:hypothetical protein KSF78_0006383 [Schistosoma japonicum]|nr:hypothetical protein KSF78_0006383 [Schistosoma japonicum]